MSDHLKEALEQLQAEIDQTQTDTERQQRLKEVKALVQQALAEDEADHAGLKEQLQELGIQFEVDHPALSRAMEMVINGLSSLGI
jgi:hypothetical protein